MNQSSTLYVGMDGHQDSIAGTYGAKAHGAAVVDLGTLGTRPCDLDTLSRSRPSQAKPRLFVYEAGPCGSWLSLSRSAQQRRRVRGGGALPHAEQGR
jgi:hypothetical protein